MGFWSDVTNVVTDVVDTVQDAANAVVDTVQDGIDTVIDGAQSVVNRAVDTVQDGLLAVAGGADGLFGTSIFSDAMGYVNAGIDTVQDVNNKVIDKAQEARKLIEDTVQAAGNSVVDNLVQIPLAAPSLAADFIQTWIETGNAPGITELDTRIPDLQGQEQGEQLIDKSKELLGI